MISRDKKLILWFKEISIEDVPLVGGKNASLGEMFSKLTRKAYPRQWRGGPSRASLGNRGINIPDGFALTTNFYWRFLRENKIEEKLKEVFSSYARQKASYGGSAVASGGGGKEFDIRTLQKTGREARKLILKAKIPSDLEKEVIKAYKKLAEKYGENPDVAVRSSGVCEDQPSASFAGQFESFLNVRGEGNLLAAIKRCLASSFGDRVIAYRQEKKISQLKFALSIGIQKMVRSDLASSGVIFTLDTESGFKDVVLINSIWGVGEMIVKGKITPDEFYVFKPTLKQGFKPIIVKNLGRKTKKYIFAKDGGLKEVVVFPEKQLKFSLIDEEILTLAQWACLIEEHYGKPQDIEWAKDGKTGQLFIVQSRPETVHTAKTAQFYEEYKIQTEKQPILTGIAIGEKIGKGKVRIIPNVSKMGEFQKEEVLVTKMTDPDWVPIMRQASAIITDEGGRTCHAAIISRELGIPAIVGTKNATKILENGQIVTVDCASGGRIFLGEIPFRIKKYDLKKTPKLKTKIMVNIGAPDIAFKTSFLPNDGVGLARIEFILAEKIRIHPLALYHYKKIRDQRVKNEIDKLTYGYKDKRQYFTDKLTEGISQIAAAFYPKPVIVRFSDFKSNEYAQLSGGELFEPEESNPMLGWRGASRYYDENFKPAFEMECRAIKKAREIFGLKNIWTMVPFCRTIEEGKKVLDLMRKFGLERSLSSFAKASEDDDNLKIIVMCEIPSNVILVDKFLEIFDGMSIGSNDLTQLILGIDRDNAKIAYIGDERNEAVKEMMKKVIEACKKRKKYCGICGQAPSDYPEFSEFLVEQGIESMSINPDVAIKTILNVAEVEKRIN